MPVGFVNRSQANYQPDKKKYVTSDCGSSVTPAYSPTTGS